MTDNALQDINDEFQTNFKEAVEVFKIEAETEAEGVHCWYRIGARGYPCRLTAVTRAQPDQTAALGLPPVPSPAPISNNSLRHQPWELTTRL